MDYVFFTGDKIMIYEIVRDEEYIKTLIEKEKAFWKRVATFDPPEPEYAEITNPLQLNYVEQYLQYLESYQHIKGLVDYARTQLIESCEGKSMKGGGVTIQRQERKGNVDYKAIPELEGVDLEKYRKEGQTIWTIRAE